MKTTVLALVAVLLGGLAVAGTGCTAAVVARPAPIEVVAVAPAPPARVYYGGHWLVYRSNAYYYYDRGGWVVARAVPTHVARYHRPVHVRRAVPHRAYRPAPVHRTRVRHRHHKPDAAFDKAPLTFTEPKLY